MHGRDLAVLVREAPGVGGEQIGVAEAGRLGLPFLGRIPLAIDIRKASDAGTPNPAPFEAVARAVADRLNR